MYASEKSVRAWDSNPSPDPTESVERPSSNRLSYGASPESWSVFQHVITACPIPSSPQAQLHARGEPVAVCWSCPISYIIYLLYLTRYVSTSDCPEMKRSENNFSSVRVHKSCAHWNARLGAHLLKTCCGGPVVEKLYKNRSFDLKRLLFAQRER